MTTSDFSRLPMSTYTVVPCWNDRGLMQCIYLNAQGYSVPPDSLNCQDQGFSVDFLCIQGVRPAPPAAALHGLKTVEGAVLLAAVAKTLQATTLLPNTFMADAEQRIVFPVMPQTTRGVILVFSITSPDGRVDLVARQDPEIKNTTFG